MQFLELLASFLPIHLGFSPVLHNPLPDFSRYEVKDLPGIPQQTRRNWAGRIRIPDTENGNALFFWLYEATDPQHDDNLISM